MAKRMPDDVYLTLEATRPSPRPRARRRVLIVGLPLLHILSERRAARGDRARVRPLQRRRHASSGPWIYRTRETIGRTVAQLSDDDGRRGLVRSEARPGSRSSGTATRSCASPPRSPAGRSSPPTAAPSAASGATRTSPRSSAVHALRPRLRRLLGGRGRPGARTRPPARRSPPASSASSRTRASSEAADRHLTAIRDVETGRRTTRTRRWPSGSPPSKASRPGEPDDSPCAFDALQRRRPRRAPTCSRSSGVSLRAVRTRRVGRRRPRRLRRPCPERSTEQFADLAEGITFATLPDAVVQHRRARRQGHRPRHRGPLRARPRPCSETRRWSRSRTRAGRSRPSRRNHSAPPRETTFLAPHVAIEAMRANELDAATLARPRSANWASPTSSWAPRRSVA